MQNKNEIWRNKLYLHIWIIILLLFTYVIAQQQQPEGCHELTNFLPMPKSIQCNIYAEPQILQNPCKIAYVINNTKDRESYQHFIQLIQFQQQKTFKCRSTLVQMDKNTKIENLKLVVYIDVTDPNLKSAFTKEQQSYQMEIQQKATHIKAKTYVGFVRALETFMQSISCDKYKAKNCVMKYLPIIIRDQPIFTYRSLMIDTARHYLPVDTIYETIDALMYNKMNVLHWHIVDQDSFPLRLDSHPQMAEYGAFSSEQIYTTDQVKSIIRYALIRGVRIIPELDTPGHSASWGRSPQNFRVACSYGRKFYKGSIDITRQETYKLIKQVFAEIFQLFPDPFVHLGGDEISLDCLTNQTQFAAAHKGEKLKDAYRKRQRSILKELNSTKRFIYWTKNNSQISQADDIIQWWGRTFPKSEQQLIISNFGTFNLDMGLGNTLGTTYGAYQTWLDLYKHNIYDLSKSYTEPNKVIGAQVVLWSETSNQYVHHLKIWIRTSSFAERMWNILDQQSKPYFLKRLTAHERLMNKRGIPTSPATCQQCQINPQFC